MNTTTNTRGVKYTPEQVERQASILSDTWGVGEAYKMLRAYAAALSAPEPAAQGDVGPVVAWMTKAGRVINTETRERVLADAELGGEYIAAAKAAEAYCIPLYTAPPAQPAARVPEGCIPIHRTLLDKLATDMDAIDMPKIGAAIRRWVAAYDAKQTASHAPSDGGKGVEG